MSQTLKISFYIFKVQQNFPLKILVVQVQHSTKNCPGQTILMTTSHNVFPAVKTNVFGMLESG